MLGMEFYVLWLYGLGKKIIKAWGMDHRCTKEDAIPFISHDLKEKYCENSQGLISGDRVN